MDDTPYSLPLLLAALFGGGFILAFGIAYGVLFLIERHVSRSRRPRTTTGQFCRVCRYDLRESPFRCPE